MLPHRPLDDADLARILPLVLVPSAHGRLPGAAAADSYLRHLRLTAQRRAGWLIGPPDQPRAVCLAILPPDDTALFMLGLPGAFGIDPQAQLELAAAALAELATRPICYAQALLDPNDDARRQLLLRVGFTPLTELIYLERSLQTVDRVETESALAWQPYAPETHAMFAHVVAESYRGSTDCPELAGLRPMDAVLAAHKASGPFDPALWQLALEAEQPVGCIMLSRIADARCVEIVYVGVAPSFRARGMGRALLRRGIALAASDGATALLVVVDVRNHAARRLYARFGFRPMLRRIALLRR